MIPVVLLGLIPTSEIPAITVFLNAFASVILVYDWFLGGLTNTWKGIIISTAIALLIYAGFIAAFLASGLSEFGMDEFVALHSNRYMFLIFFMLYSLIFVIPRLVVAKVMKIELSVNET
jgi:hypothetical protein